MAERKTQENTASVKDFLNNVKNARRRQDSLFVWKMMEAISGKKAKMWGPSIVGYGRYHYKYDSGREGDFLMTGFSPRKSALTVYVLPGYRDMSAQLERLGKHKTGKSCLYINKLADIDIDVLEEIVGNGLTYMRANYETWDE